MSQQIPIQHELSPAHRQHAQECLAQIKEHQQQIAFHKAAIYDHEREISVMTKHLGVLLGLIEQAEHLPPSLKPYELSPDGTKLLGVMDAPPLPKPEPEGESHGVAQ